jgi:hypothetical protein
MVAAENSTLARPASFFHHGDKILGNAVKRDCPLVNQPHACAETLVFTRRTALRRAALGEPTGRQ